MLAPPSCDAPLALGARLTLVTPASLALVSIAALILIVGSAGLLIVWALRRDRTTGVAGAGAGHGRSLLWIGALFLIVFAAKLLLMRANPVTAPYWDQWDAEARTLFLPFSDCRLSWQQMFALHNEHRVFFTRLLALDLLLVNGQWDPRVEQVVNALMHALTAVLLAISLWRAAGRRRLDLIAVACALAFAPPIAWDNTLLGFQSAFYFLLFFSVSAIGLMSVSWPGRMRVIATALGWACAVSALFTSAGGVVTAGVIAGLAVLRLAAAPREWRGPLITMIGAALVLALGVATSLTSLPQHAPLRAQSIADLVTALGHNLAWPWVRQPWAALAMWAPMAALMVALAARRLQTTAFERGVIGVAAWVILNAGAVAYGRGAGGAAPATRYMDFLSLGFVANLAALLALLDLAGARLVKVILWSTLAAWMVFAVAGVDRLTRETGVDLAAWRPFFAAHAANVRQFVLSGEREALTSKRPVSEVPYPDPLSLALTLEQPYVRRILPAAVRAPLRVEPREVSGNAFVTDSPYVGAIPRDPKARYWWSLSEHGRQARGRFESQTLECESGGRLRFTVSGYLGWEGHSLALREQGTGRSTAVEPGRVVRESVADVIAPCPAVPFSIDAVDDSADSWFGFREPIEVGWMSLFTESLIAKSRALLIAAIALAALAARLA